jgi:hypothetical protein
MSSWGNNDNAAKAPLWAATQVNVEPNSTNRTNLFDNTTQDYWASTLADGSVRNGDKAVGVFGVDAQESAATHAQHTGWTLRTVGYGGRAGRVQNEVLVALSTMSGDSDAQVYANVTITLTGPSNGSVTAGAANSNTVSFTVTPTLAGNTAAALTYQWQVNNGVGAWVNMADGNNAQPAGVRKAGVTSATFLATPWNTTANNFVFRCVVTAADQGVTATSANAYITIY